MDLLLVSLMVTKLLERFMKKNCKWLIKKNLEKNLREKKISYKSNGKVTIILLIVGLIKMKMSQYFLNHIKFWRKH